MKKTKQLIRVMMVALLFSAVSLPAYSSCNAPFTGEFILCEDQVDQFWREVEANCEGTIIGPVTITVISCVERE